MLVNITEESESKTILDYLSALEPSGTLSLIEKISLNAPYLNEYKSYSLEQAMIEAERLSERISKAKVFFENNADDIKFKELYGEIATKYDYLSFVISILGEFRNE
jgi:uncharacterized protein YutD